MRRKVVFGLLLVMLGAFAALLALRGRSPHAAPNEASEEPPDLELAEDAGVVLAHGDTGPATASPETTGDAGPGGVDTRIIRVVGLGWDVLAPGVLGNGGTSPGQESTFAEQGVETHLRAVATMAEVEQALATGGAETEGADVAILPLPEMVAAYERLRALSPHVFFVVGWSMGRHALFAPQGSETANLVGVRGTDLLGRGGEPATFLALFALATSGIELERVHLVAPDAPDPLRVTWAAVDRAASDAATRERGRRAVLTTADASRLVPYVAIAPEGFLRAHGDAATDWTRGWLAGVERLEEDVPAAARQVAAAEGAPEAVDLLRRLGQLSYIGLRDNARLAGLAGRGAVTLDTLVERSWSVWRDAGVLTTPAPSAAPIYEGTIIALVRADMSLARPRVASAGEPRFDTKVLLRQPMPAGRLDEEALVSRIGLLAGVFERSALRVGVRGRRDAHQRLVTRACERFGIDPDRFERARRLPASASAVIEVLAAP